MKEMEKTQCATCISLSLPISMPVSTAQLSKVRWESTPKPKSILKLPQVEEGRWCEEHILDLLSNPRVTPLRSLDLLAAEDSLFLK